MEFTEVMLWFFGGVLFLFIIWTVGEFLDLKEIIRHQRKDINGIRDEQIKMERSVQGFDNYLNTVSPSIDDKDDYTNVPLKKHISYFANVENEHLPESFTRTRK